MFIQANCFTPVRIKYGYCKMLIELEKFLLMGGYALYVWPAYGVTMGVFLGLFLNSIRMRKKMIKKIHQYYEQTT